MESRAVRWTDVRTVGGTGIVYTQQSWLGRDGAAGGEKREDKTLFRTTRSVRWREKEGRAWRRTDADERTEGGRRADVSLGWRRVPELDASFWLIPRRPNSQCLGAEGEMGAYRLKPTTEIEGQYVNLNSYKSFK